MDIPDILQFVDEVVSSKTGKHLNDLQRGIIEGTLKRQRYTDIAETYGCTAGHAKDEGYKLLQILSNIFNETVDKNNLKSVLDRQINLNIAFDNSRINNSINNHLIGCINFGSDQLNSTPDKSSKPPTVNTKTRKSKVNIELINKLRLFGLNDEQISEVLNLSLDAINQVDL
ncbi:hypothetical protein [Planktothrix mougeotii]|uniref:vWA-MoxR associated protein N-terminal HTH domain-containing protein n=1 Tax=Planktothrix mougeotii LEGE 06226 TaxID=1828728 RepID=A0ABR9U5P4_9CYAN|nr:hypothetical protein [Planktothrix mougeotii]MBE9141768.1 hypothetical protein [Planktothrix mougeotii LEGE 06226]